MRECAAKGTRGHVNTHRHCRLTCALAVNLPACLPSLSFCPSVCLCAIYVLSACRTLPDGGGFANFLADWASETRGQPYAVPSHDHAALEPACRAALAAARSSLREVAALEPACRAALAATRSSLREMAARAQAGRRGLGEPGARLRGGSVPASKRPPAPEADREEGGASAHLELDGQSARKRDGQTAELDSAADASEGAPWWKFGPFEMPPDSQWLVNRMALKWILQVDLHTTFKPG
jgi:hypothetical protein